jgi:vesicle-fusing ATPase
MKILKIHTEKMRINKTINDDVDLAELAHLTKNFSGAELAGLVKSATSFALNKFVTVGEGIKVANNAQDVQINRANFINALEEVRPAFGVSDKELENAMLYGILHYNPHVEDILKQGSEYVSVVSRQLPLLSVLLHGPSGSGKTALAAKIAKDSGFPFIKLISAEDMVGFNEMAKIQYMNNIFLDAYKSPLNIVVIDDIELIIEWSDIGPRFSNSVLQAIMVLIHKSPPAVSPSRSLPNFGSELTGIESPPPGPRNNITANYSPAAGPTTKVQLRSSSSKRERLPRAGIYLEGEPSLRRRRDKSFARSIARAQGRR